MKLTMKKICQQPVLLLTQYSLLAIDYVIDDVFTLRYEYNCLSSIIILIEGF